jgi:hypothetical protein
MNDTDSVIRIDSFAIKKLEYETYINVNILLVYTMVNAVSPRHDVSSGEGRRWSLH